MPQGSGLREQYVLVQLKDEDVRRMLNLARLIATLIASKAIQITVLKVSHCCTHQISRTEYFLYQQRCPGKFDCIRQGSTLQL